MWLLYARSPAPDAQYWPGRRWLAALDALLWPALMAALLVHAELDLGLLRSVGLALCAVVGLRRGFRAVWRNERYRFTSWTLGVPLAGLLAFGALLTLGA